jgi:hypothetical protein
MHIRDFKSTAIIRNFNSTVTFPIGEFGRKKEAIILYQLQNMAK